MKVTFNLDLDNYELNDKHDLELIMQKDSMYHALTEISEYLRQIDKGNIQATQDEMIKNIRELIYDSKVNDIY
ncbi:MAG: hypothetical protein WC679_13245 [Bacteroidales bacterium]|jgi:hypothetical protein